MLISVKISKFRTCEDVEITGFQRPLVLLGPNGAGKTNVLHAIAWAANAGATTDPEIKAAEGSVELVLKINDIVYAYHVERGHTYSHADNDQGLPEIEPTVTEKLWRNPDADLTNKPLIERYGNKITIDGQTNMTAPFDVGALDAVQSFYAGDDSIKQEINSIKNFLSGIRYYPLLPTRNSTESFFFNTRSFSEWKASGRRSVEQDSDLNLLLIDAWMNHNEKFQEINDLIGPSGLGLVEEMWVFSVAEPGGKDGHDFDSLTAKGAKSSSIYAVNFVPIGKSKDRYFGYPLSKLSMGTKRVIQLFTHLLLDRISVALIEQPEDALHPALLHKIIGILQTYSEDYQCVMTSHSPDVFNCTRPEDVRVVEISDQITSVYALSSDDVMAAVKYMEEDGTFAEFLEML